MKGYLRVSLVRKIWQVIPKERKIYKGKETRFLKDENKCLDILEVAVGVDVKVTLKLKMNRSLDLRDCITF